MLGAPAIGQQHELAALPLETSPPEVRPIPARVHHLEARDSTLPAQKRRRRPPTFTAVELRDLQGQLAGRWVEGIKNKPATKLVKDELLPPHLKEATDRAIVRKIIRPVRKLRTPKRRKLKAPTI
jgi:hypothetical protein